MNNTATLVALLEFLDNLKRARICFKLSLSRDNAIMVEIVVPGERWEVEFMADGTIEVERFRSTGEIWGSEALKELFEKYGEPQ